MSCAIVDRVLGTGTLSCMKACRVASEFWLANVRLGLLVSRLSAAYIEDSWVIVVGALRQSSLQGSHDTWTDGHFLAAACDRANASAL